MAAVIVLVVIAFVLFVFAAAAIKIVRPFQRGIIEQLGRYKTTTDPGLKFIIPLVQTLIRVDMREQVVDVPPQEVITKDNVTVTVDAVIYYEPTDAQRLVYNVANFLMAITKLLDRRPFGLSGGEAKRVALARALAASPDVLCLDEPLSALDEETHGEICDLLGELHREIEVTILHITHSSAEAHKLGETFLRLEEGQLIEGNPES